MKIFNHKLAARIKNAEHRLLEIRSKSGAISSEDAKAERDLQAQIDADTRTLYANGYTSHGKKWRT